MELVSANTRNYLFLTMSQYNEQNGLVRARCTMRRDQAFWQGGNSFVACESFRISSAPSQGGLYYTILPDTFYVGASNHQANPQTGAVYENLVKGAANYTVSASTLTSYADEDDIKVRDVITLPFKMGIYHAGQANDPIPESDPDTLLPIFSELWSDHGVSQKSDVRMLCAGGVVCEATVMNNPLSVAEGQGMGPNKLFYPISGYWQEDTTTVAKDLIDGKQALLGIFNFGYPGITPDAEFIKQLNIRLGTNARFEITKGVDGSVSTVPAALRVPGLELMGPQHITVSGLDGDLFEADGTYKTKLYWDLPLKVGASVYIIKNAVAKYGTVTELGDFLAIRTSYPAAAGPVKGAQLGECYFRLTDAYKTWLNDNSNSWGESAPGVAAINEHALDRMLAPEYPWVLETVHLPEGISVDLNLKVTGGTGFEGFKAALPIQSMQIKKYPPHQLLHRASRMCSW